MNGIAKKLLSVVLAAVIALCCFVPAFAADSEKPFPDSCFYEQGDYSIHYRSIPAKGQEKGYILFLHGFLYSGESFVPMAEKMSEEGYTCVVADCPGFGYSTRESENIEPIDREELMTGLMKSIAPLENWVVAGQSMGGGIAVNIACEHPEIKALLLYAPAPIAEVSPAMEKLYTSKAASFAFNGILKLMLKMTFMVKIFMYAATMDIGYTNGYELSTLTDPLAVDGTADSMLYMMIRARATDYEAISKITVPVLLARGDKDLVVTASMAEKMDAALPITRKITVNGGGHMINETHCDYLSGESAKFLAENA